MMFMRAAVDVLPMQFLNVDVRLWQVWGCLDLTKVDWCQELVSLTHCLSSSVFMNNYSI